MAPKVLIPLAAIATAALAQSSSGCNGEATLTSGVQTIDGREYTLLVPENYDSSNPYRLIFGFHWLGGSMDDVVNGNSVAPWYGLEALAEGSAIFVAPNGIDNGWPNQGGADIAFVDSIIEQIESDLCVDQGSRFATGFSYGGGMSYSIACSRAGDFRAVAPMAAGLISGCDGGNDPIAYLGIHGISDDVLPIDGGIDLANTFVENNGCTAQEVQQPAPGSGESVRTDFEGCSEPVSFIAWDGGHVGAPFSADNPLAPEATWEFFSSLSSGSAGAASSSATGNSTESAAPETEQAPSTGESENPTAETETEAPSTGNEAPSSGNEAPSSGNEEAPVSQGSDAPSTEAPAQSGSDNGNAGGNPWEAPAQGGQQGGQQGNGNPWESNGNPWQAQHWGGARRARRAQRFSA
ncbi:hypothetical protein Q7P37_002493 [Cladosporium fusiforme]